MIEYVRSIGLKQIRRTFRVVLSQYKTVSFAKKERREKESSRALHLRAVRVINTERHEKSHSGGQTKTFRAANFAAKVSGSDAFSAET